MFSITQYVVVFARWLSAHVYFRLKKRLGASLAVTVVCSRSLNGIMEGGLILSGWLCPLMERSQTLVTSNNSWGLGSLILPLLLINNWSFVSFRASSDPSCSLFHLLNAIRNHTGFLAECWLWCKENGPYFLTFLLPSMSWVKRRLCQTNVISFCASGPGYMVVGGGEWTVG